LDQEIDDLFQNLKTSKLKVKLEKNQKSNLIKPSQIPEPEKVVTPTYD
jgi:hypothetical protein